MPGRRDAVDQHQRTLGLLHDRPGLLEFGDRLVDGLLHLVAVGVGEVDVEPGRPDHGPGVVAQSVTHDDDLVDLAGGVDDAVFAAERFGRVDHPVQNPRDVRVVLGMLVGEQQGGGGDDFDGLVAVHPGDGIGPFPPLPVEEEPEAAHPLRFPTEHLSVVTPLFLAHRDNRQVAMVVRLCRPRPRRGSELRRASTALRQGGVGVNGVSDVQHWRQKM